MGIIQGAKVPPAPEDQHGYSSSNYPTGRNDQCNFEPIKRMNSLLDSFLSNSPQNAEVVVTEFCFCTPRIIMQR
jgi:hypothetical protein